MQFPRQIAENNSRAARLFLEVLILKYTVLQIINNNTVYAKNEIEAEPVILIAKGLGFGTKKGSVITDEHMGIQIYKLCTNTSENSKPL